MPDRNIPVKVFLAEDSPAIRGRVAALLRGDGMTVIGEADTPKSCVDGILALRPEVVVLDVQLSGGSGLEVLQAVRAAAPDIAFVALTIHSDTGYRKLYLDAGAHRFLDKAAEFDQLAGAVAEAARHAQVHH